VIQSPSPGADGAELPEELAAEGSLSRKTSARVVSDVVQLLLAAAVGVATARFLGPAGKGTFATLALLGLIAETVAGGGLGEATVVRVGQGRIRLDQAVAATLAGVAATSALAALATLVAGAIVFSGELAKVTLPLLIVVASVPVVAYFDALQLLLYVREHIVAASKLAALASAITTAATLVFLGPLHWGLAGALGAAAIGPAIAAIGCAMVLERTGAKLGFRWDTEHIRWGLGYGTKVQSAYLAGTLAARFDLVLVFAIAGSTQAGYYSIALTIGAIVGLVPWSVSQSTFPRIAAVTAPEARQLTVTICRLGLIAGLSVAIALAVVTPFGVPLLYGHRFTPAIVPSLILIFGGLLSALQALLCRAISARGDPRILLVSTVTSLAVMVVADLIVIAPLGIVGAATVAALSPAVGLVVALRMRSRATADMPYLRELFPRPADLRFALTVASRLATRAGRRYLG
jgi:O-antigen/teichoic acid export membrane protein